MEQTAMVNGKESDRWQDGFDEYGNPRRSVVIHGVPALAIADAKHGHTIDKPLQRAIFRGEEIVTVGDAEAIQKAMANEEDIHVCPLCEDGFLGYTALRIHAPDCVQKFAPRRHIWLPPKFSDNVIQNYDQPVRITD